jgi:hypothetical protein
MLNLTARHSGSIFLIAAGFLAADGQLIRI